MRLIKRNIQKIKILLISFLMLFSQAVTPLAFLTQPVAAADTGWQTPSTTHAPNDWDTNTVANVQTSNDVYVSDNDGQSQGYNGFNIPTIPAGNQIDGVHVEVEAKSSDRSSCRVGISVSWDGGSNYTSTTYYYLNSSDDTKTLGGSTNKISRDWSPSEFTNSNFVVKITDNDTGYNCTNSATTSVDLIRVKVHHSTPPPMPDLVVSKTNDAGDTVVAGNTFDWTLKVTNVGEATAVFNNRDILEDDLPTNADYTPTSNIAVTTGGGLTGSVDCDISSNTLDCDDNNGGTAVSIPAGGWFSVTVTADPDGVSTLNNPRPGGSNKCMVDPDSRIDESNESNNLCSDTVTVTNVKPAPNPPLIQACGLDIALVLDVSGSIDDTELGLMKTAFNGFVDAFLPSTPTHFSVSEFSTTANILQPFTDNATDIKTAINGANDNGYTNWEDGLMKGHNTFAADTVKPDLMVFASDGNPNTVGNGPANNASPDGSDAAMNPAITAANAIKADNIRVMTLGIGNNLSTANLIEISSADAVITSGFDDLADELAKLAAELCGGTITVTKLVDADGDLGSTDDQTPAQNWAFSVAGEQEITDVNGKTNPVEVDPGKHTVTEAVKTDFEILDASCTANGQTTVGTWDGDSITGIDVGNDDIVSCTFINREVPRGSITIIKDALPNSDQSFEFKTEGDGLDDFTLVDDGIDNAFSNIEKIEGLLAGEYTIEEAQASPWDLTKIECTGSDGVSVQLGDSKVVIKLGESENVTCTFTNDRQPVIITATKIVCTDETQLPNYGLGGPAMTPTTAQDWVDNHDSCSLVSGWDFEWGGQDEDNPDDNTGDSGDLSNFGLTDGDGQTSIDIDDLGGFTLLWLREVFKDGYLPFTFNANGQSNVDNVSAEFYCNVDVLNYDNWDFIDNPQYGQAYNCVAWNVQLHTLHGYKWDDSYTNGYKDDFEELLPGWTIFLDENGNGQLDDGENWTVTSDEEKHYGWYWFEGLLPGDYSVCEVQQEGWVQTFPEGEKNNNCHVVSLPDDNPHDYVMTDNGVPNSPVYNFGNAELGKVKVVKFHDTNENGHYPEDGEALLEGWDMTLTKLKSKDDPVTQTTGPDGSTTFTDVDPRSPYVLSETLQDGWQQTSIYCEKGPIHVYSGEMMTRPMTQTLDKQILDEQIYEQSKDTTYCYVGNTYEPVLTIAKTNDTPEPTVTGDSVVYTITVTVPEEGGCVYREGMVYPSLTKTQAMYLPYGYGTNCATEDESMQAVTTELHEYGEYPMGCYQDKELTLEKTDEYDDMCGEVMVTDLPPVGFEYVPGSWEAYSNVRGNLKSAGITTEPTYASPGQWNLTNSDSPFLVPGEVVTLTYVALIDSAVTNGDYPDTAFVEGYTNSGGEKIYGNLHFTGDNPFVGTQVTVLTVDVTEQGYVLGTLQVTGSPAILAPIIGALLAVGAVLTVTNRKKRRLFKGKGFGKSFASLGLGLMISVFMFSSAFAAGFWTTNISTPEAYTTNGAVNIDYQVTSTDATDTFDVSLLQDGSSILMQSVTTPYGDSGRFPLTLTTEGTYVFKTSTLNNNGGGTKVSDEVTVTFDKTAPAAPTYSGVTRSGDTYTLSFTAPTGNVSTVNVYASTSTSFDLDASTKVGEVAVTPGEETQFVYTAPDSAQRYFALTSEDAAGNQSPAVGDVNTVVTTVPADGSTDGSSSSTGTDADGTVSEDGATADTGVEGTTDENTDDEASDTGTIVAMSGIILFVVLAGAAYFVINTNRKPQE